MANIEKTSLLGMVYPVGSIYMSVNATSPSALFGGTGVKIEGRFLLGSGGGYSLGATGGEAEHTLTQAEIPNYYIGDIAAPVPGTHANWNNHGVHASNMGATSSNKPGIDGTNISSGTQWSWRIESNGGDQAHNNMPPYLAVNIWKRTA